MTEGTQIRESRGNHGGAPGGRNGKASIKVLAFLPLAICCMAGVAAGVYLNRRRAAPVSQQNLTYRASVISGDTPGGTREQRQKELDSVVEEGMLVMSMNVAPFGKTTKASYSINWMIENPSNQGKLIRVEITCNDAGGKVSETGTIRLGSYLESNPSLIPLPTGEYDCAAVFLAYQEKIETLVGQTAIKIRPVLQEREEGNVHG